MYFFVPFDNTIVLTNDKKSIFSNNWEDSKKYLSSGGKVITNIKKVRDAVDRDRLSNNHFAQILGLRDEIKPSSSLN